MEMYLQGGVVSSSRSLNPWRLCREQCVWRGGKWGEVRLSQRYGALYRLQPEAMPTTPHALLADLTIQMDQKDM
jgi:hypothetical protein